jgi:hypothetical protein
VADLRSKLRAPAPIGRLRERRRIRQIERLGRDNDRLKSENTALRREFKEIRSRQARILQLVENPPPIEVRRRSAGLLGTLLVAALACLVGMRLGRERYDQLITRAKGRLSGPPRSELVEVPDVSEPIEPATRGTGPPVGS